MNFRTDLEILALDPQVGGMTIIEARAADGSTAVLMVRVAEPLAVGGHMTLALTAEPAAAPQTSGPSMRDRLQARLGAVATNAGPAPRLAITLSTPVSAGASGSQPGTHAPNNPPATSAASAPAPQTSSTADASSLLLSSILGASPRSSVSQERNVDDEMDALFGARRKG